MDHVSFRFGLSAVRNVGGNVVDGVGLTEFGSQEQVLSPISATGPKRQQMLDEISGITTDDVCAETRLPLTCSPLFHEEP